MCVASARGLDDNDHRRPGKWRAPEVTAQLPSCAATDIYRAADTVTEVCLEALATGCVLEQAREVFRPEDWTYHWAKFRMTRALLTFAAEAAPGAPETAELNKWRDDVRWLSPRD
jgi:hypothetical protein